MTLTAHTHRCCTPTCRYTWSCIVWMDNPDAKICPVDAAAKSNKDGPYCALCQYIELAKRAATLRDIQLVITRRKGGTRGTRRR